MSINKTFNIAHTRLRFKADFVEVVIDRYNSMTLIVEISYNKPDGYYLDDNEIPFALYLDRKFYQEFYGKVVKLQLQSLNVVSIAEVSALPHSGFRVIRGRIQAGTKIQVWFSAKRPDVFDVERHVIYYDNNTGTFETKAIGIQDAATAEAGGRLIKEGRFLTKEDLREPLPRGFSLLTEDGQALLAENGQPLLVEYAP